MPKKANQKLKLLYIKEYLLRNTDENHSVTVSIVFPTNAVTIPTGGKINVTTDNTSKSVVGMESTSVAGTEPRDTSPKNTACKYKSARFAARPTITAVITPAISLISFGEMVSVS